MVYNNPPSYHVDFTPEMFAELADEPTIVAIKESSDDIRRLTDLHNACGDRYLLFCGVDDLVLESVLLGAVGWVSGLVNAFPEENCLLWDLATSGRWEEARAVYRWYMPLLHLDTHPKVVQYIKLVAQECGLGTETVRRPAAAAGGRSGAHPEPRPPDDRDAAGPRARERNGHAEAPAARASLSCRVGQRSATHHPSALTSRGTASLTHPTKTAPAPPAPSRPASSPGRTTRQRPFRIAKEPPPVSPNTGRRPRRHRILAFWPYVLLAAAGCGGDRLHPRRRQAALHRLRNSRR